MSEPLRTDDPGQKDAALADREARIEQLLLSGLDHYFVGQYDQAVHVWTRVVFLDRSHDRARAYIERARRALAERQRESDELVQRGIDALNRGENDTSRQLLNDAISRGGPNEVALAFLDRLNRIEAGSAASAALPVGPVRPRPQPAPLMPPATRARRHRAWIVAAAALCAVVVGALFLREAPPADDRSEVTASVAVGTPADPLPVPRSAEITLVRARTLYESGRFFDALRVLDTVPAADALRAEADRLRGDVQRELLAGAVPPRPSADTPLATGPASPPER